MTKPMVTTTPIATLDPRLALSAEFADAVRRHADGLASADDLKLLRANRKLWVRALYRLLDDVAESIDDVRHAVREPHRDQVLSDLESDYQSVEAVLRGLVGPPPNGADSRKSNGRPHAPAAKTLDAVLAGTTDLQLSWVPGRVIAWAGGPGGQTDDAEQVLDRLRRAGAGTVKWEHYRPVKLDAGGRADSVSAPIQSCIGWLVALGDAADTHGVGTSVAWLGLVSALAVRLTAQGRLLPQVKKMRRRPGPASATPEPQPARSAGATPSEGRKAQHMSGFEVRWTPVLVESAAVSGLAASLPGAAAAFENQRDPLTFTQAVLADMVDAIATEAAARVDTNAPPPEPRTRPDTAEAALARLDGTPFEVPTRHALDLGRAFDQWGRPVTGAHDKPLIVKLTPPEDNAESWQLSVLSEASDGELQPVEQALVIASRARRLSVKHQLVRLERLCPELLRLGGRRRGEVTLNSDEAWGVMTEIGPLLEACGYEVRVPDTSKRRPNSALRLTALDTPGAAVGADQLANVRWSVLVDDELELSADDIRELAKQARPIVRSRGEWVELDRADLNQTAKALEERGATTRMTGADMLRHALGLEGSPTAGGTILAGQGWATDLIRSARRITDELPVSPEGFRGRLRNYQAEALVWVDFLEGAGLGGCLALDMGLGKTLVMLAHINNAKRSEPSMVIAPPAVVGNWVSEARRFTPGLRVAVHHGPGRCTESNMGRMVERADMVVTTYGTALRDIELLEQYQWATIVADEAQAIKNHTSETARQLRRLQARTRVTLTGTPIENGLGDLWSIMDFCNPGLLGPRNHFIGAMTTVAERGDTNGANGALSSPGGFVADHNGNGSSTAITADGARGAGGRSRQAAGENALAALNGLLVFRRTKAEPVIAAELPDRIDGVDYCSMTTEQVGLYQAVLDQLAIDTADSVNTTQKKGVVLAAITALKQICNHPVNYRDDSGGIAGRSGKLTRLEQILANVFAAQERALVFTHFATWGEKLAAHLSEQTGIKIECYHGGLARGARDRMVERFQRGRGAGALVLSLKAGGTGLNLTAANHVVLYDRWWNPAVEDQARDRAWRIGQRNTVVCHRLVCPGTVDERVEEIVAGKRHIANMVLPKSSSIGDLDGDQLQVALGIDPDLILIDDSESDLATAAEGPAETRR